MNLRWIPPILVAAVFNAHETARAADASPKSNEPAVDEKDLPRFPAVEPADAIKTFQIKKGFKIEFAAHEPEVMDPIAISFDEKGRMFVVEMRDYSERRDEHPHLGRIRMLEDKDGDGYYETSTIFADDLPWPTGVICANGGVFVAATPDIIFLKDTKGTGRADVREVVFTGFGTGLAKLNVQGLMNCFNWGLDNRIHMQCSTSSRGAISSPKRADIKPQEIGARDFWFDPRTFDFGFEAGGGQYGFTYDSRGRKIVCSNSDHVRLFVYDSRYAARNPFFQMPSPLQSIAADGGAAEVYRISPDEPWRIVRTRWRVAGVVPGIVEGGGRVSGYFTGATGATVYRGDAFGSDFADNVFVGDAGGNLIHRKKLFADGASLVARRPDDEQTFEFAASKDTWCRPVNFANAPDGALYAIDMYREIIEHPDSIPPAIKKHLDLNSGNDRGRIYRIVPENFTRRAKVDLSSATTAELVATLAHPNGWHRDTAARLLYEKQDQSAVPLLEKLAADSSSPLGRMHALHALDGLWGALSEKTIVHALNDNEPVVREHAILLSEKFLHKKNVTWKLFESLEKRIADPDARVRLQLAFSLGENFRIQAFISHDTGSNMPSGLIDKMSVLRALSQIAKQDAGDPWISAAVLSTPQGVPIVASHLLAQLASDKQFVKSQYGEKFLAQVVQIIGARNNADEVANALNFVAGENTSPALVRALGDGLKRAGTSILAVDRDGKLKPVFANAAVLAADRNANPTQRADALSLLSLQDFKTSGAMLAASLHEDQSEAVQLAAIDALGRFSDAQVADELLRAWPDFKPRLRSAAFGILSARPDRALVLLGAIENGQIKAGDLSSTQSQFLVKHRDKRVSELATKLLVKPAVSRDEVIGKYQSALTIKGDTARGRKIYSERCVSCHRAEGSGFQLGPDFVTVKTTGREKLLVNILDPNREVAPQYLTYLIETKDGESLTGIIVNDAPSSVTLRQPFGKEETIPRAKIRAMSSPGTSLMPEGLEAGLTPAQFADLLDFIESLK